MKAYYVIRGSRHPHERHSITHSRTVAAGDCDTTRHNTRNIRHSPMLTSILAAQRRLSDGGLAAARLRLSFGSHCSAEARRWLGGWQRCEKLVDVRRSDVPTAAATAATTVWRSNGEHRREDEPERLPCKGLRNLESMRLCDERLCDERLCDELLCDEMLHRWTLIRSLTRWLTCCSAAALFAQICAASELHRMLGLKCGCIAATAAPRRLLLRGDCCCSATAAARH